MSDRIEAVRQAVESIHGRRAVHADSEAVIELFRDEVAWDGVVETFDITGHPKAKRCNAWSYREGDGTQFVAVLEIPPVDSPETAVRVAIAAHAKNVG